MGTSQSSNGAPSNQPIVPPWTPELPQDNTPEKEQAQENEPASSEQVTAPPGRFNPARRSIGEWVKTGDKEAMRKGLGQYIKKGYGGNVTASKRLAATVHTASGLLNALTPGSDNPFRADGAALSKEALQGKSAHEIVDIIIETVKPVDGSQDTEASRDSMKDALSELLTAFPEADLQTLSDQERQFVIERFVAGDVFRRIDLDLGKNIRQRAASMSVALSRLREIKDYVKETVSAAFREIAKLGQVLTNNRAILVVQNAIKETCEVFEGYAE